MSVQPDEQRPVDTTRCLGGARSATFTSSAGAASTGAASTGAASTGATRSSARATDDVSRRSMIPSALRTRSSMTHLAPPRDSGAGSCKPHRVSWEDAWREGRTGWDAGRSAPALEELVASGTLPEGRALVPGCGAGYDVLTLASPRRTVVGLDVAPTAAARFDALRAARGVPETWARVEVSDFFSYRPEQPFDLIFDYTFLCAIDPSERPAWARQVDALLAPDGELVTLIFPATEEVRGGPPFALPPDAVRALLEPRFRAVELRPVQRAHPGREGKEWLGRWRRA